MHKLNVLIFGPKNFISTLDEIKNYLKFDLNINQETNINNDNKFDIILCHEENIKEFQNILNNTSCLKILATGKDTRNNNIFDYVLKLPTSIEDLNKLIENAIVKKQYIKNSSIEIKSYLLNKNEKKLIKEKKFIVLTEKEIHLLELFLLKKKAISKNQILSLVWQYSAEADTHTVETHIYRLRKKISEKFSDDNFILNNKEGYFL